MRDPENRCPLTGFPVPPPPELEPDRALLRQALQVLTSCIGVSQAAERNRRETIRRVEEALLPAPRFVPSPEGAYAPPLPGYPWG